MTPYAIDLKDVRAAAQRLAGFAHGTPVLTCTTLDRLAGRHLFFKCEHFQKAGAFKFRGACNAVMKLSPERAERGVVTHSSGNHAQALASGGPDTRYQRPHRDAPERLAGETPGGGGIRRSGHPL